ncbi:MAG: FtsX-like permease family protein, partial [Pseudohongiellaceae bacterium]
SLQRLDDIYLNPLNNFGTVETSTSKTVLLGLVVFSILILATSCINYMNLSLAQLSQRNREIGVRKTLGASRRQIIAQFLVESLLLTVIALFIAIPLVAIALPTYTNLTETGFSFLDLFRTGFIAALVALVVVTGVVAGFIPAVSVSHLQPASIVKNANTTTRRGRLSKAAVTTAQFALSTALMLLAIAIYVQTNHLRELDVGYNRDNLVILDSRYSTINPEVFNYTALVNELEQHPGVLSVATSDFRPPGTGPINPWRIPRFAPDETITVAHTGVSPGFIETYEMELLAGRSFSEDFVSDFIPPQGIGGAEDSEGQVYGIVITDLLARRFGFDSPDAAIGQSFDLFDTNFRVIGVVKRFQFSSGMEAAERSIGILRSTVSPMRYLHLRLDPMQTEAALNHIDTVWERHQPSVPIERTFFAQTFDDIIADRTDGLSMAALMASVVTVLIAGFGLYALASYSSLRRTKEVGIRKALGATADSIVMLLAWDFIKPVLVACVIAWPIAWFAIEAFYAGFTSRAGFSVLIYGVVTGGVLAVALLTVAIQCFRTANSDPVKSLRYE